MHNICAYLCFMNMHGFLAIAIFTMLTITYGCHWVKSFAHRMDVKISFEKCWVHFIEQSFWSMRARVPVHFMQCP
jgi:hypothetical protein